MLICKNINFFGKFKKYIIMMMIDYTISNKTLFIFWALINLLKKVTVKNTNTNLHNIIFDDNTANIIKLIYWNNTIITI